MLEDCPLEEKEGPNGGEKGTQASMSGICFNCGACDHTLKNCRQKRRAVGIPNETSIVNQPLVLLS